LVLAVRTDAPGSHVDSHDGMHAKAPDGPEIGPVRGRAEAVIGSDIGMSRTTRMAIGNNICRRSRGDAEQRRVSGNNSLSIKQL
jgi:hypothetical protein